MNESYKYDDTLMNIIREEKQIIPFLDVIFGFLHRRTDFFLVNNEHGTKIGFPSGHAEEAVRGVFRKWQELSAMPAQDCLSSVQEDFSELVIHEEEVVTTEAISDPPNESAQQQSLNTQDREDDLSSDSFNGADCGHYRWSQTFVDVDIKIPVASTVIKSSSVSVDIKASQLTVSVLDDDGQWITKVDGQLSNKHLKDESIWTLMPGKHINVHLQKSEEKLWDSLLTTEAKLDRHRLDMERHVTELEDEDKMQIEKLMINEERERLGLPSIAHQGDLKKLKKAWDTDGSPFKGTPFDPSVLE